MINTMLSLLIKNHTDTNTIAIIDHYLSTIKAYFKLEYVGCYWTYNQEWYDSQTENKSLSKQIMDMSVSLLHEPSLHQSDVTRIITATIRGYSVPVGFIPIQSGKSIIGIMALATSPQNQTLLREKDELSMFAYHLASIFTHAQERMKDKKHYHEATRAMTAVIESLDPYLKNHSLNVANYALLLAKELNVAADETERIYYGALFHDIGKIGTPLELLQKPNTLSPSEFEIIKQHPSRGALILNQFSCFKPIASMVLHHHEMWGGGGYPEGLSGEAIPFGSRLIAVVDAYDAITTNRSYRKAQKELLAIDIIKKDTPQQFDPTIVNAFIQVVKNL